MLRSIFSLLNHSPIPAKEMEVIFQAERKISVTAKAKAYWSIWIGLWTGIYVLLYLLSPLAKHGIIWCTFIALPIFFNGGALRKDYIPQMICSCVGVICVTSIAKVI